MLYKKFNLIDCKLKKKKSKYVLENLNFFLELKVLVFYNVYVDCLDDDIY